MQVTELSDVQPRPRRVAVGAEDGDLAGLEPSVPQGRVGDEAREAPADNRTPLHSYLTEPASSPSTK